MGALGNLGLPGEDRQWPHHAGSWGRRWQGALGRSGHVDAFPGRPLAELSTELPPAERKGWAKVGPKYSPKTPSSGEPGPPTHIHAQVLVWGDPGNALGAACWRD